MWPWIPASSTGPAWRRPSSGVICQPPEEAEAAKHGDRRQRQSSNEIFQSQAPVPSAGDFFKAALQIAQSLLGAGNIAVDDIRLRGLFVRYQGHGANPAGKRSKR